MIGRHCFVKCVCAIKRVNHIRKEVVHVCDLLKKSLDKKVLLEASVVKRVWRSKLKDNIFHVKLKLE